MSKNNEPESLHGYFPKVNKGIGKDSKRKGFIINIKRKSTQIAEPIQPPKPIRKTPGQKIPKRLSPLHYWNAAKNTTVKKNTHISIRDVIVNIYWHFDNVCIGTDFNCQRFSASILNGLQTLRKDYEIEKIIGIGDKYKRFSEKQRAAFDNDPLIQIIDLPYVDRRKPAVKECDESIDLIHRFLVDNPSFFGQSQYVDRIDNDPSQLHLAKHFIAKYFMALKVPDLEKIAPAHFSPPYFRPTQHLTEYKQQIIADISEAVLVSRPGPPASESVDSVYISKTDLAEVRLLQVIYDDVLDYGPPKILMLISSDAEFATTLLELKNKGFSILLASNDVYGNHTTPLRSSTHAGWVFGELIEGENYRYYHDVAQGSKDCYEVK